jgi:hypothetical protein
MTNEISEMESFPSKRSPTPDGVIVEFYTIFEK